LNSGIRQTHNNNGWQPVAGIDFNFYDDPIKPNNGASEDTSKHDDLSVDAGIGNVNGLCWQIYLSHPKPCIDSENFSVKLERA